MTKGSIDLELLLESATDDDQRSPARAFPSPSLRAVAERLESFIADLPVNSEEIEWLHQRFDAHQAVDYDFFADAFTYRFFLTNFWKTAVVLEDVAPLRGARIVDLGCGSGAATIAALAWLHDRTDGRLEVAVTLVDRCARQLELADRLLDEAVEVLDRLRVQRRLVEVDITGGRAGWKSDVTDGDLVLVSHLLTENVREARSIVGQVAQSLPHHGQALVIERDDDPAWAELTPRPTKQLRYPEHELALNGFPARRDHPELSTRYVRLRSSAGTLRKLVARYFLSWQQQDVAALDDVFASDAIYQDKPFAEPIRGLDGIRSYWERRVLPQRQPRPKVVYLGIDGPCAFIEWQTDLVEAGEPKTVKGMMLVGLDASGERIGRLREYYASHRRPPTD